MEQRRNNSCCVTISTQRSGTKLLGNCFNKGTEVLSLGELFHNQSLSPVAFRHFAQHRGDFAAKYSVGSIFELLDAYFSELQVLYTCVHLDVMYSNLAFLSPLWWDKPGKLPLLDYFRSRNFAVIHLVRSPLECYASIVNAETSGKYHRTADGDLTGGRGETKGHTDLDKSVAAFREYEETTSAFRNIVDAAFEGYQFYCRLDYESMLDEEEGMLSKDARVLISSVIQNGCSPWDLQHRSVDLVKSIHGDFATQLAAELRKGSKAARKGSRPT
jgi:hypothetical protein